MERWTDKAHTHKAAATAEHYAVIFVWAMAGMICIDSVAAVPCAFLSALPSLVGVQVPLNHVAASLKKKAYWHVHFRGGGAAPCSSIAFSVQVLRAALHR